MRSQHNSEPRKIIARKQRKISQVFTARVRGGGGGTALTRAVSGEKQIYSGNLEILPGIGKPVKFFGKYGIFLGH